MVVINIFFGFLNISAFISPKHPLISKCFQLKTTPNLSVYIPSVYISRFSLNSPLPFRSPLRLAKFQSDETELALLYCPTDSALDVCAEGNPDSCREMHDNGNKVVSSVSSRRVTACPMHKSVATGVSSPFPLCDPPADLYMRMLMLEKLPS